MGAAFRRLSLLGFCTRGPNESAGQTTSMDPVVQDSCRYCNLIQWINSRKGPNLDPSLCTSHGGGPALGQAGELSRLDRWRS